MFHQHRRLITSTVAALAVIAFAAYGTYLKSGCIFMNAPLSLKHEALSGKCNACHSPWKNVEDAACVKCHKQRMHFTAARNCDSCHSYSAKHKKSDDPCVKCHKTDTWDVPNPSALPAAIKASEGQKDNLAAHFEKNKCSHCHREHEGKFQNQKFSGTQKCVECHIDFRHGTEPGKISNREKPSLLFSHEVHLAERPFKKFGCDECHRPGPGGDRMETPIKFMDACGWCHELDRHDARSKDLKKCSVCHTANDFKVKLIASKKERKFTYSHLKHPGGNCADCHNYIPKKADEENPAVLEEPPTTEPRHYRQCLDCHKDKMVSTNCGSCHSYHAGRG